MQWSLLALHPAWDVELITFSELKIHICICFDITRREAIKHIKEEMLVGGGEEVGNAGERKRLSMSQME